MTEFLLEIILKHRKALDQSFVDTMRDREEFSILLSKVPYVQEVYQSGGNFILIVLKQNIKSGKAIVKHLLERHAIYIKDVSSKFSKDQCYLRLAVRFPQENERLVECLNKVDEKALYC